MSSAVVQRAASGLVQREAVSRVARRLRLAPGTITRIVRGTAKRVTADARDALICACIDDLAHQIERLEHERHILLQMGEGPSHHDMDIVDAALATAREALARMTGGRHEKG